MANTTDTTDRKERTTEIIARLEELEPVDDTLEQPIADDDSTLAGAIVPVRETKLADVANVAGAYARERRKGAGSYIKQHPKRSALVIIVLIVAIFALVMAGIRASKLPSEEDVQASARARVETPDLSGGFFGFDDPLALASVEVGNRRHLSGAPEGTDHDTSFGATGYAEADVTLSYRNQYVSAVKTATLGFAEQQGSWVAAGEPMNEQVTYAALMGVNEEKVLSNIDQLLEKADTSDNSNERSLTEIYEGANLDVQVNSFDALGQTNLMIIQCTSEQGIATYNCVLTAEFTFLPAYGLWELTSASVTEGAKTRSLELLEGTWEGSFQNQNVNTGNNCLAASSYPMKLVVDGFDELDGKTVLNAHVTLLAHFHEPLSESKDYTSGDHKYSDEILTCTLVSEVGNKLVFEGSLPERTDNSVNIRFEVDGDSRITALVATTHRYTETTGILFWETTENKSVTYTDTYDLRRAS